MREAPTNAGPLAGIRVVELAGLGPVPHACMQLADLGAEVVQVVRPTPGASGSPGNDFVQRGRTVLAVDLKDRDQREELLTLISRADVLIEGFRPGVAERLGLGPQQCQEVNPRLVYARLTGYGQDGPLALRGGHDVNYVALTGALHAIGTPEQPVLPLSLVGNYGGGSMLAVAGVLAALVQRQRTGLGEVIDIATIDGTTVLLQPILELRSAGQWSDDRGVNLLDGGRPYYRTYECSDGGHLAVGAMEPQFYANLLAGLRLDPAQLPEQDDPDGWPVVAEAIGAAIASAPRAHWEQVFAGLDACVTPVLTFAEAAAHPQIRARRTMMQTPDGPTAAPAPRFASRPEASTAASRVARIEDVVAAWKDSG